MIKKIIISLVICLLLLGSLSGCMASPPVRSELVTDSAHYLQTNQYVQDELGSLSARILPDEIASDVVVLEYRYTYNCAVFGDPNYSIKLVLQYGNVNAYRQEYDRICNYVDSETEAHETHQGENLFFGNTIHGLDMLSDNKIEDGNSAIIQYVFFDSQNCIITYVVGHLYDGGNYDTDIVNTWQNQIGGKGM